MSGPVPAEDLPAGAPRLTAGLATTPPGATPVVEVVGDLAAKREVPLDGRLMFDSWFAIGHLEAGGHEIGYLVHAMAITAGRMVLAVEAAVSVTDRTTGWYAARSSLHPGWRTRVRSDRLHVRTPTCLLAGTLDDLRVRSAFDGGGVDLSLTAVGHPLYNRGGGRFTLLGLDVHQYSVPTLRTTGQVVVDGREHEATGTSWFDRQWQRQRPGPPAGRWTWMDLNLSNGWHASLWDAVGRDGAHDGWVTVVDADGAHTVAAVVPLALDAGDHWRSGPDGARFPTRWVVRVPDLRAELTVEAVVPGQALRGPLGERYEGASAVRGVVDGQPVEGHCYVEMVGDWRA